MVKSWIRRIRLFLFVLLLPFGILGSLAVLHHEGFFTIQDIHLSLAEEQTKPLWLNNKWDEFEKDMEVWRSRDLWTIQLSEVTQKLSSYPWISEAMVSKSWPNTLHIQVRTKSLVAYATTPRGRLVPLLADGSRLNFDSLSSSVSLPILSTNIPVDDDAKIQAALRLISNSPKVLSDRMSEIGYDSKEGYWTLILPFGAKIKWGFEVDQKSDPKLLEKKIFRVQKVLEYLDSRELKARVIDANLSKKVVVRLRKTP